MPPAQDSAASSVIRTGRELEWTGQSYGSYLIAMDDSDEALMARIARGDERAFQLLSRRHLPAMLGLARRILANAAEAEDVAQEAFLRVWTHAPRWQPLAQFRTWLTRIVVNLCLDRKRRAPWVDLEAAGDIADPAPGAGEKAESDERQRMVAAAIDKLPPRQRDAIMLTYSEGMSNAQVAEILGTSVSAVETLLVRGKQNLRRALGDMIDKGD
jgi:RNA polymerase sigma-70 factor, ECF subfamily